MGSDQPPSLRHYTIDPTNISNGQRSLADARNHYQREQEAEIRRERSYRERLQIEQDMHEQRAQDAELAQRRREAHELVRRNNERLNRLWRDIVNSWHQILSACARAPSRYSSKSSELLKSGTYHGNYPRVFTDDRRSLDEEHLREELGILTLSKRGSRCCRS